MPGVRAICSPWGKKKTYGTWDQDSRKSSGSSGVQVGYRGTSGSIWKDSRKSSGSRNPSYRTQWTHMENEEKAIGTKRASGLMQEETTLLPVLLTVKESRKQKESSQMQASKCDLTNTVVEINSKVRNSEFHLVKQKIKIKIKQCHRVHLT